MASSRQFRFWTLQTTRRATAIAAVFFFAAALAAGPAQAQQFSVLYRFANSSGGYYPESGVIMDQDGNLYGTNYWGGTRITGAICPFGCGTIFKLSSTGSESTLFAFGPRPTGRFPQSGLVRDAAGNLYGTAGAGLDKGGVLYKLDPTDNVTVLHAFPDNPTDGTGPLTLTRDAAGNFYGTTAGGGVFGLGTVFKLDTLGAETVLYSFGSAPDGYLPSGSLIRDAAGNLYGVTSNGGYGYGTVYKLDATGAETVLYRFTGGSDGSVPLSGLVRDSNGNFYGTTYVGGVFGSGTVYKLDVIGVETVLHSFAGGSDGAIPYSTLLLDSDGNLYGTTGAGGPYNFGTVFKLNTDGTETILHFFSGRVTNDGLRPTGDLIRDSNGNLYGTTHGAGGGTVYKVTLPH
jgi:uncharacterized repeat protein (TIGR03803 family)